MRIQQIFLTLIIGQFATWLGIQSMTFIGTPLLFPFIFGISIPIANWNSVQYSKWATTLLLGIFSTILFFTTAAIGFWFLSIPAITYVIVGLSGLAFLSINSLFISNIYFNRTVGILTLILVSASWPIGKEFLSSFSYHENSHLFHFSTFMTTAGLCFGKWTIKRTKQ